MKKRLGLLIPLVVVLMLGGLFYSQLGKDPNYMPSALVGQAFPEFTLTSVTNPEQTLGRVDTLGRVALVNIWGTWCPSCRAEHGYLLKLAGEGVPIVGVDYKDDRAAAQQWLSRLGDPYVLNIFDPDGRLGLDLGVTGAPETFVIDHRGQVRHRHIGVVDDRVWQRELGPLYAQLYAEQQRVQKQGIQKQGIQKQAEARDE